MMKTKILLILLLIMSMFASCSKSSKIQKEAKKTAESTFKEFAKDPSSVHLSDEEIVYSDDSLCIIHLILKGKNGLGVETTSNMEYMYINLNKKAYEAYHELDTDSVYLSNESYEKDRKGKIYEKLSYEQAMFYRAANLVNSEGRVVGNKQADEEINIPIPTGTGAWQLSFYKDEFGETSNHSYLFLAGKGSFDNSATTGSDLTALLLIRKDSFSFSFLEYNSNVAKFDRYCSMRIKDSNGDVHGTWYLYNDEDGFMSPISQDIVFEMKEILSLGGTITVSAEMGEYSKSQYRFKMNVTGYDKSILLIK